GHTVHLSADREESLGGAGMVERLAARFPRITIGWTPGRESGAWYELARKLRLGVDYVRFLDPRYDAAPRLRGRSQERTPQLVGRRAVPADRARPSCARLGAATVRAGDPAQPRARHVLSRAGARSRPHHAARRSGIATARSLPQCPRAGAADGTVRRKLGSPV